MEFYELPYKIIYKDKDITFSKYNKRDDYDYDEYMFYIAIRGKLKRDFKKYLLNNFHLIKERNSLYKFSLDSGISVSIRKEYLDGNKIC